VDSLSGASLRPYARELLSALHRAGATLVLWSAGGSEHATDIAGRHGFTDLLDGVYAKLGRNDAGCLLTTHLPERHRPTVVVDDRPEDAPAGARVWAVLPYMAADDLDRGLVPLLVAVRTGQA
jgi:phosphoglycolate phosphatase-like HAD superfamily hydrolase